MVFMLCADDMAEKIIATAAAAIHPKILRVFFKNSLNHPQIHFAQRISWGLYVEKESSAFAEKLIVVVVAKGSTNFGFAQSEVGSTSVQ